MPRGPKRYDRNGKRIEPKFKKWTAVRVEKELRSILKEIQDNSDIIVLEKVISKKEYCASLIGDWVNDNSDSKIITGLYGKIKETLLGRLLDGGIRGDLKGQRILQLMLGTHYGIKESVPEEDAEKLTFQHDHSLRINFVTIATREELEERRKKIDPAMEIEYKEVES